MNYETIRLLSAQMGEPADNILSIDADLCDHEENLSPEVLANLKEAVDAMKVVISDDSLSYGVRLGFMISTAGMAVAKSNGTPPSQVFLSLAKASAMAESMAAMDSLVDILMSAGRPSDTAPTCDACGTEGEWCASHRCWECPSLLCNVREIPEV